MISSAPIRCCISVLAATLIVCASVSVSPVVAGPASQSAPSVISKTIIAVPSPRFDVDRILYVYQEEFVPYNLNYRLRLWRSSDAGESWRKIIDISDRYGARGGILVGLPSPGYDVPTVFFPFALGVPGVQRLWRSVDGGDTWEERTPPGWSGISCSGPVMTDDPDVLFAACGHMWIYNDIGIDRSRDNGATWSRVWSNTGSYQVAPSPAFASDQTVFASVEQGYEPRPASVLNVSFDGGDTWQARDAGLCDKAVNWLALSPAFDRDRVLFAVQNGLIFKSEDAGSSWVLAYADSGESCEPSTDYFSHVLYPSPNYPQDHTIYSSNSGVLYVSYNDGVSWQRLTRGANARVVAIRRQPAPATASAKPRAVDAGLATPSGRFFITGHQIFLPLIALRGPDPRPLTVFISGSGVPQRSDDGGVTWTTLNMPLAVERFFPQVMTSR